MYLKDNLRFLRLKKGYSQDFIADFCEKKSFTTVQKWESGDSEPSLSITAKLADLFNVTINDFVNTKLFENEPESESLTTKIPILGEVAAGVPIDAIEDILGWTEVPKEWSRIGDFFALKIKGDSMMPRINEGDIVIVKKQENANNGDLVVVTINGESATCKKIKKTNDGILLISLNNKYEPFIYNWADVKNLPVSIIGKVVEMRAKF